MIEYAAFGWATLTWWTWPVLMVTVVGSVYAAWYITLRLVAHDRNGRPKWCFERDDHVGPCRDLRGTTAEEHAAMNRLPHTD